MPMPAGEARINSSDYPIFTVSSGNAQCKKIYGENTKMANIDELKSIFTNNSLGYISSELSNFTYPTDYVSSNIVSTSAAYWLSFYTGALYSNNFGNDIRVFCIKR